jgi:glycosyltransferase involved in cell wall biosynthesis
MQAEKGAARPLFFSGTATVNVAVPSRTLPTVELTILMPCLNEAKTVAQCVAAARDFLNRHGVTGEVLVADNGSQDDSRQLAEAAGARVIPVSQRGYGAALLGGIAAAQGRYVIMGDADCSYDFSRLEGFLERLREGADLVMGDRFAGGIENGAMPVLHRYLGNPVLSFIGRLFFRTEIRDFHCGLRGFSRASIARLGLVTSGMEFASEMVAKAALAGLRIDQVPTTLRPDGRDRPPHLRTWRDGWRHLRFLLLFCPRWLFLYPGIALTLLGLVGFAALAAGPVRIADFALDIHSMLYMSVFVVLGTQLVQLAFVTKWLGVVAGVVPSPPWLEFVRRWASLELGLVAGFGLFAVGLGTSAMLATRWQEGGFGALDPREVMRSAIPAATLMIVGMQLGVASLFGGALNACWKSRGAA